MTYTPVDNSALSSPVAALGSTWTTLVDNVHAAFLAYAPRICIPHAPIPVTSGTPAARLRFKLRGNVDDNDVLVTVTAQASSGTQTVTVSSGAVTANLSVTTLGQYTATLSGIGADAEIVITASASAGTLTLYGVEVHVDVADVKTTTCGYRRVGNAGIWSDDGAPIPSEAVSRMRNNMFLVAQDRPVCVAVHACDLQGVVGSKTPQFWGAQNSTQWVRVGQLVLPAVDTVSRLYRFDAYTTESASGAEYGVKIGPTTIEWTGTGWHSETLKLGPGPHDVYAIVKPGTSNAAAIRTAQIWRTAA